MAAAGLRGKEPPHIVFIFSDDLSFRDLSAYGQKRFQTPHLDQLAATGTRFTQAYTGAPECAPSRSTLLTSLHVGHTPIRMNSSARGFEPLPADSYTFAHMLQDAGYNTAVIGKWGLGYLDSSGQPLAQGFDYHFGYLTHYEAHSYFPRHLYRNNQIVPLPENDAFDLESLYGTKTEPFEHYYDAAGRLIYTDLESSTYAADLFDEEATRFIHEHANEPFLLYFTTNLPHSPTIVDDLRQMADDHDIPLNVREWAAMVERLDISVGRLVAALKAAGIYDNTLIVFASDNGYTMEDDIVLPNGERFWPDNPDLKNKGGSRGGKFSAFEGGMRVPLFMKLPGQSAPVVVSEPVWLLDLFPTFAALAGQQLRRPVDGFNLLPLVAGDPSAVPADRFMYFYRRNQQSARRGPWFAFRQHPDAAVELYLVEEDLATEHDLAGTYPTVAAEFAAVFDTIHEPHPWYWNPGDTNADFEAKKRLAAEQGLVIPRYRPNHIELMPWERR